MANAPKNSESILATPTFNATDVSQVLQDMENSGVPITTANIERALKSSAPNTLKTDLGNIVALEMYLESYNNLENAKRAELLSVLARIRGAYLARLRFVDDSQLNQNDKEELDLTGRAMKTLELNIQELAKLLKSLFDEGDELKINFELKIDERQELLDKAYDLREAQRAGLVKNIDKVLHEELALVNPELHQTINQTRTLEDGSSTSLSNLIAQQMRVREQERQENQASEEIPMDKTDENNASKSPTPKPSMHDKKKRYTDRARAHLTTEEKIKLEAKELRHQPINELILAAVELLFVQRPQVTTAIDNRVRLIAALLENTQKCPTLAEQQQERENLAVQLDTNGKELITAQQEMENYQVKVLNNTGPVFRLAQKMDKDHLKTIDRLQTHSPLPGYETPTPFSMTPKMK